MPLHRAVPPCRSTVPFHRLQELTPEKVKTLMEEVIRTHLGWLIVWGNIFGGGIGVITYCLALLIPGN